MKITIKAARINKNLLQKQAAKLIGVSKDTISAWERGLCTPNSKYIPAIEKVYCVTYSNLIFLPNNNALSVKRKRGKNK
ncbi:helix-turn-helix transcriptional regulator [Megamonas hypermegale]|uniref:helix-turn-helix transcriptional regulator n=1 Tax=Megamonas hypermegale TaxID=158847 RepID=UPI0026EED83D|nr:helix-turn-helix transcriptional regulator [Megamonas hypermegale]